MSKSHILQVKSDIQHINKQNVGKGSNQHYDLKKIRLNLSTDSKLSIGNATIKLSVPRSALQIKHTGVRIFHRKPNSHPNVGILVCWEGTFNKGYWYSSLVQVYWNRVRKTIERLKGNLPGKEWAASYLKHHHNLTVKIAGNIIDCELKVTKSYQKNV